MHSKKRYDLEAGILVKLIYGYCTESMIELRRNVAALQTLVDQNFCDPKNVDKVYSTETISKVTLDGGKTWTNIGNNQRHVDDHALWIDPGNTKHFYIGGDGGVYETFDLFNFKADHPARSRSDTYYVVEDKILRTHTTVMWYYYFNYP